MPSPPSDAVHLHSYDLAVFAGYMLLTVVVGFWAARGMRSRSKQYFLGDKAMPWYVVGASMVSTNISSEHFIANVGAGGSDLAWSALGGVEFNYSTWGSVQLGYRALDVDYDTSDFGYDMLLHGPFIAFTFRF